MMGDAVWKVLARSGDLQPYDNWQIRMVDLLGFKPRRASALAQAALYGVFDCMSQQPSLKIEQLTLFRMTTQQGARSASEKIIAESRNDLPMPFSFLQSQLSQALMAVVGALKWQGDASVFIASNPHCFIRMALLSADSGDVLLGWADEIVDVTSLKKNFWVWLRPCELPRDISLTESLMDERTQYIQLNADGVLFWSETSFVT